MLMVMEPVEKPPCREEEFLQLVLDAAFDAVLVAYENGRLWNMSSNAADMFGIAPEKIDQAGNVFSLFGQDFFNREELKRKGRIDNLQYHLRNSDHGDRTLQVNIRWTAWRGGMILFCCRDITAIKKAEQVLREDARMKDEFTSAAGHALRSPLTVVQGYAELLLRQPDLDAESRQRFLALIFEKAQELSQITNELLYLSRSEPEQNLQQQKTVVEVKNLLERITQKTFLNVPLHRLDMRLPETPIRLFVDENEIERVLENLLDNAVKFSPPHGLITLGGEQKGGVFHFWIEDEGIGMTPDQQDKAFDKFYRADGSNSAITGLGLGMSIARKIVEDHGGRIWLESTPGKGTTVNFTVPISGEQTSSD
jgi:PAS domain S-box-containing protein